jgi:hypothetical protein
VAVSVTNVSAPLGILIVPPLLIEEIVGVVKVLLVSVCVAVRVATVSVISGNVIDLFAVVCAIRVSAVEVVDALD